MVQINFAQKQVNAKVVYYGPGMSGKTTNLEIVHQRAPSPNRGELTSISTDGDRTLFFDFMPLDLGTVAGMRTCFQIYTVPGQVYYNSTRKLVLQGVDGVVFVADSSASMIEENLESLRNLEQNLNEYGKSLATVPHVIQFNKRDLPDALPVEDLNKLLNPHNAPFFEAVANTGQGVFPTLKALAARVLETIHSNNRPGAAAQQPAPVAAPAPMAMPVAAAANYAQPAVSSGKTGFYNPSATSPATVAAAQRALAQTGFHGGQAPARTSIPLGNAGMPPPLAAPARPVGATPELARTGMHAMPQMQPMQPVAHGQAGMPAMMAPQPGMQMPAMQPMQQPMPQMAQMQQSHAAGLRLAPSAPAGSPPSHGGQGHSGGAPNATRRSPNAGPARAPSKGEAKPGNTTRVPAGNPAANAAANNTGAKKKGWVYAALFLVLAVGVGAVVAKVFLKVF